MNLKDQIDFDKCPRHVAIIMDGNGRWAKQQGKSRLFGHSNGVEAIRNVLKASTEIGVKYLTLYAFSTENWGRPEKEVNGLMNLMVETIANEVEELDKNNVRLRSMGEEEGLPEACRKALGKAIASTSSNDGVHLIVALNYSAKWEIVNAVKKISRQVKEGEIQLSKIDAKMFAESLYLKDVPDPELLIRTSGEYRISNFMLWQIAYSELYFTERLWPDFSKKDFFEAIMDYQNRERRFGKISEQLKS